MLFTINNKNIEKVIYNNKQVNITKYNNNIILEDNYIAIGKYAGNPNLTSLNDSLTVNLPFTSNNVNFTKIKITSTYVYYVNDSEETPAYSYSNKSWANAYKTINITNKTFVDSIFYDWFGVNYIKN